MARSSARSAMRSSPGTVCRAPPRGRPHLPRPRPPPPPTRPPAPAPPQRSGAGPAEGARPPVPPPPAPGPPAHGVAPSRAVPAHQQVHARGGGPGGTPATTPAAPAAAAPPAPLDPAGRKVAAELATTLAKARALGRSDLVDRLEAAQQALA